MGEVNTTPPHGIRLKKSKSLSFVGEEKFLESAGVKIIHDNMIKAIMEFSFIMEVRMKVRAFLGDSLNKNFRGKNSTVA